MALKFGEATEMAPMGSERFVPRDRESFLDAQARHRRATWRLTFLSAMAAVIMGIPLALVVTPLLYGFGLMVADTVNLFSPLPPAFWKQADEIARFGLVAFGWLLQQKPADPQALVIGTVVMLLPGTALSVLLWIAIDVIFHRAGVGGALLALRARDPNPAELKELRLADVVDEMAIAAGIPAPKVMLIDAPGANAAVIGTSPQDARVVITRPLIDDFSRDELEGVLAHLIGSIANGDLRIAFRITAVFETCGLLVAVINSPFGSQSRRTLWRIFRYAILRSPAQGGAQEAAAVSDLLTRSVAMETNDIDRLFDTGKKSMSRSIAEFLLFPIFLTNLAIKLSLWFFSGVVLGPTVALLWRTREYLADSMAVQLTRNPDALASALQKLNADRGEVPRGGWASHLFIVDPGDGDRSGSGEPSSRQKAVFAQAWAASAPEGSKLATGSAALLTEFTSTYRAALAGNARAIARLQAAHRTLAQIDPALAATMPDPADLAAARQGDLEAVARLRAVRLQSSSTPGQHKDHEDSSSGGSTVSLIGFHPSLKRRLKRLARMGAHVDLAAGDSKAWKVTLFFTVLFGPLFLLLAGMFLLLIAVMVVSSLGFLVIWLAIIHKLFTVFAAH